MGEDDECLKLGVLVTLADAHRWWPGLPFPDPYGCSVILFLRFPIHTDTHTHMYVCVYLCVCILAHVWKMAC